MKNKLIDLLKRALRFTGIIFIKPGDSALIADLKKNYKHSERSFLYGRVKYVVDSLDCHATPGTLESVIEYLSLVQDKSKKNNLLNLGGGVGQVSQIFAALNFSVVNVDIDITNADKNNLNFDLNSTAALPLENNYFDFVVCQEIIEHLENPWNLIRLARKHLKAGAYLIVTTPNIASRVSRNIFRKSGYFKWFTPDCFAYHVNPLAFWELEMMAERLGCKLISLNGSGDYYFNRHNKKQNSIIKKNESLIFIFKKI